MSKILVIDDEEEIRNTISMFLTFVGYDVVTAKDGEEGVKKFDESLFDIVITDLSMPKCNGDEVARHVHKSGRKIPVVVITGTPWDIDLSVFDRVIDKPFLFEEFIECIESVMGDYQSG